jgi:hypothetical protein
MDAVSDVERLKELRKEAGALREEAASCADSRRREYLRDLRSNVVYERDELEERLRRRSRRSR